MMVTYEDMINLLAQYYGILSGYWDIKGIFHETPIETKASILTAMNLNISTEAATRDEINTCFEKLRFFVPSVVSLDAGDLLHVSFYCHPSSIPEYVKWSFFEGTGEADQVDLSAIPKEGKIYRNDFIINPEAGVKPWVRIGLPDTSPSGTPSSSPAVLRSEGNTAEVTLEMGFSPSWGYHKLMLTLPDNRDEQDILIIVAPPTKKDMIEQIQHLKGISLQLYGIASKRNCGIGDLRDLTLLGSIISSSQKHFLGLNPLHLLFPENPKHISPYSPSSRRLFNPWYIHLEDVAEYSQNPLKESFFLSNCTQERFVKYEKIVPFKFNMLNNCYKIFKEQHALRQSERWSCFMSFCDKNRTILHPYGFFEAFREVFQKPWYEWPEKVDISAETLEDRSTFYRYLQFLLHEQMDKALGELRKDNILLYMDLPLSVDAGGFDAWLDKEVYSFKARIGAPPDDFNPEGQEWGLIPFLPHKLKEAKYRPFIEVLNINAKRADILRIDHIMGLFRLFWIPGGGNAKDGAYVLYPMEDLVRIAAIESYRNNCIIVGEDLGTVTDEIRWEMSKRRFLSYKVFYFEKHPDGSFKKPDEYPQESLAAITTHDLPTIRGYWMEKDIELRRQLGSISKDFEKKLREERKKDKAAIIRSLKEENLLSDASYQRFTAEEIWRKAMPPPKEIVTALHRFMSKTRSRLISFQIEDLLEEEDQPNLPGTTDQYPSWRFRWSVRLEDLKDKTIVKELFN